MVGNVYEVYEIDADNLAWVEEWWVDDSGNRTSHSMGLESAEMEIP
jgi:hypothetical protein